MSIKRLLFEFENDKELQGLSKIDREKVVYKRLKEEADNKFKFIKGGSSRKVYEYKDGTVVKVAWNAKGIAQNEQECGLGTERYTEEILARVHYCAENFSFLIMEKAEPVDEQEFERIAEIPWDDFLEYIRWASLYYGRYKNVDLSPEVKEYFETSEFLTDFEMFISNYDQGKELNDYTIIDHYGKVKRDGQEMIVIIDYGLSKEIFDEFYK